MVFLSGKRTCLLLVLLSVAAMVQQSSAATPDVSKRTAGASGKFIEWTYKETPMGLYLPAPNGKPLPVVMFLHGCHNNPVTQYHWIIAALNAIEPCAVFLPTAPETKNTPYTCADWGGTYDSDLRPQMINAHHELDSLIAFYGFDKERQYLYGESMGGEGVYRLLMDFPARFAGAVDVAGYTISKGAAKMAQTPLWIVIGGADEMSPVDSSRGIYNAILDAGGTLANYKEYPDLGHVAGIEKAREEPALLTWLLNQRRSTGVLFPPNSSTKILSPRNLLRYSNGNLYFPERLQSEATITLFDYSGSMLFRVRTQEKSVKLPVYTANRFVVWKVVNEQFAISGKMSLLPK